MARPVNKFKENDLVRIKGSEDMGVYKIESVMLMLSSNKDTLEYFYNLKDRLMSAREDELIPAKPLFTKGSIVKYKERLMVILDYDWYHPDKKQFYYVCGGHGEEYAENELKLIAADNIYIARAEVSTIDKWWAEVLAYMKEQEAMGRSVDIKIYTMFDTHYAEVTSYWRDRDRKVDMQEVKVIEEKGE